jgi:hypothetical protein
MNRAHYDGDSPRFYQMRDPLEFLWIQAHADELIDRRDGNLNLAFRAEHFHQPLRNSDV